MRGKVKPRGKGVTGRQMGIHVYTTCIFVLLCFACSDAEADQISFEQFPSGSIYKGKTRLPDFSGRDREFAGYRTRIRDGLTAGSNFAGHYSVIQYGCGTGCIGAYVADNQTGKVYDLFPRDEVERIYLNLAFRTDSRLIIAQWVNYDSKKCNLEYYAWEKNGPKIVGSTILGGEDVCFARKAGDPLTTAVKNLPEEFAGIWMPISADQTQCPNPLPPDLLNMHATGFEQYGEEGCDVRNVSKFPNSGVVQVDFNCGGEGQSWHRKDIMTVSDFGKQKVLVMTSIEIGDFRGDDGKPMPPDPNDSNPHVELYLKCN